MQTAEFDRLYKRLNIAQKNAVDTIDGPVMVIAGPGTGKTSILTLRIANILKRTDTPANGILAITYTNAGVKAIREKLKTIIGDRAHDIRIHTFHSFASSVIAEYPDHFLHIQDMKLATDIEQETLIRNIILDPKFLSLRPTGKPDAYMSAIMRAIDDAKREALTPEMVREYSKIEIEKIKKDEDSISTRGETKGQLKAEAREAIEKLERTIIFSDIYEKYEVEKKNAKKMDYNDLLIELLVALRKDELLLRLIQERYLYIHVDEHQDTNDVQNFIIGLIAEFFETPNIFIVGDEKQAIYRFQGASVENFLLLKKRWPLMKVISLPTNYRSHQSILDATFSMIEKNYEEGESKDLRIHLTAGGDEESRPIEIVTAENSAAMEIYLVKALKEVPQKSTVAVIVRRNQDLDRVIRLLESHNIPVSSERSVDIFSHPIGRIFFDLIEYIVNPEKADALARTIVAGMWGLSFENSATLVRDLRSDTSTHLEKKLLGLSAIRDYIHSDSPVSFLIHIAKESGFSNLVIKDPSYVHVWRGIISLSESLARDGNISDPSELMKGLIAYKTSAESRLVKVTVGAPDVPIQAMTAHASKGLEFDYVFIPYATEEAWVGRARGTSFILPKKRTADDIRDVRRFFYVALTRAKKNVTVLTAMLESDGKVLSPLRFISELDSKHASHISLPREGIEKVHEGTSPVGVRTRALLDLAKRVIENEGLSVTALNHFIECPNKFLFLSILKMPQAPTAAIEKGNAMHEGLSKVWGSESKSRGDIEQILRSALVEYFNDSFLSITEKESAKKELVDDVPAVAKALESHFAVPNNSSIFIETWVETTLQIPIHGKLDALIDDGSLARVFDYKTRQAMSVNAIKGETKSGDGNYFRQLVFYNILVGSDLRWRNRKIVPALVFVSPDEKGRCPIITLPIETADILKVKGEIQILVESVKSGKILESRCDDPKCEWCGMREIN